jgi:hypothetical protein
MALGGRPTRGRTLLTAVGWWLLAHECLSLARTPASGPLSVTYSLRSPSKAKLRATRTNYPRRKPRIRTEDVFAWYGVVRGGVVAAW